MCREVVSSSEARTSRVSLILNEELTGESAKTWRCVPVIDQTNRVGAPFAPDVDAIDRMIGFPGCAGLGFQFCAKLRASELVICLHEIRSELNAFSETRLGFSEIFFNRQEKPTIEHAVERGLGIAMLPRRDKQQF